MIDFEVKFNWDVGTNIFNSATTQNDVNQLICSNLAVTANSKVPSGAGFTSTGSSSIDTSVGVATSGVLIYTALSANMVDPFYPKAWKAGITVQTEQVDHCLAHPQ